MAESYRYTRLKDARSEFGSVVAQFMAGRAHLEKIALRACETQVKSPFTGQARPDKSDADFQSWLC